MKVKILAIISIIVGVLFLFSGCELYDYSKIEGGEIPVTVAKEVQEEPTSVEDMDEFKKQLEKLQSIIDAEDLAGKETEEVEVVVEELEEEVEEEETTEEVIVEETTEEEVVVEETTEEEVVVEETEGMPTITVNEGELVNLNLKFKISDPDGDKIVYTFTKPLDKDGKWQTGYDDAGKYVITITAADGKFETKQDVLIVVNELKRSPIISGVDDFTVKEGETITLKPKVTDPDGGTVSVAYSGWMTTDTKDVGYSESGVHTVTIKATDSDGEESKKTITITVEEVNRAPVIELR